MVRTACILIESEQTGFFITIADVLTSKYGYKTRLIVRNDYVKSLASRLLAGANIEIVKRDEFPANNQGNMIAEAVAIENKYGITLASLIGEDRALGQGYLFNIEKVPDVIRASWTHEQKLEEILRHVKQTEVLLADCHLVIQQWPNKITSMVGNNLGADVFSLVNAKYGTRYFWTDKYYDGLSSKYTERIIVNLQNHSTMENSPIYEIDRHAEQKNMSSKYTYFSAIKESLFIIWHDSKYRVRRTHKKASYRYLGWVPSRFRKVSNYKYVCSISKRPENLVDFRVVYFSLQMEPEVSLINYSPEFNNSMEAIAWLSKSLPADTILVVKEQAKSFAVRSRWYYRHIDKIGNVVWAHPSVHSWDWIKRADLVAAITGGVQIEAVHMLKPVLSFGKHQAVNFLPSVRHASNFTETRQAVSYFLSNDFGSSFFEHSLKSFCKAQLDSSFELPGYGDSFKSDRLQYENAEKALENLVSDYQLHEH